MASTEAEQNRRAVLWDLDGTLLDSAQHHWLAWHDSMAAEGVELTYEHFLKHFGQRNDVTIPEYLGRTVSPDELARISDAKENHYRRMVRERGIELLPGVGPWLKRLKAGGWKQAIASSAPRLNVDVIVDTLKIRCYFDLIVSAEDVRRGKPDPEIFLEAASRLAVPPGRCVVVEDAPAGVEAARRAGARIIAVLTSQQTLNADVVVRRLDELTPNAFDELVPR
ncbi:MAG: HAD family phosphatase [Acidobacteria bacterium]|nr:HAD family phosphatase [Acidobacteriota bacterium]